MASIYIPSNSIYNLKGKTIDQNEFDFSSLEGKVSLIVNVACKWGKTKSNFSQLAELHKKYKSQGFEIVMYPSGDFKQELNTNKEIKEYIENNFYKNFVLMNKVHVNGDNQDPIFTLLKKHIPGRIGHNFFKYLVDKQGIPNHIYEKKDDPISIEDDIVRLLETI